jgi:hypothetical protein
MKTSVLVPSLDSDYLNDLLPQITGPDREIVVCSPYPPPEGCVWVRDETPKGNNPANRMAFEKSTGDVIVCLPDDITIGPDWWEQGITRLESGDVVVSLSPIQACYCFGLLYANCPMAKRETVERHWNRFYPYRAHWGDPAFSLSVWGSGGKVVATEPLVRYRARDGHPEAPYKSESFAGDCEAFLDHFPDLTKKWLRDNWRLFNGPNPN